MRVNVARGAALLDRTVPGWHKRIDVQQLAMYDDRRCILGQLYGVYLTGLDRLFPLEGAAAASYTSGYSYGFNTSGNMDQLADEWAKVIAQRFLAA